MLYILVLCKALLAAGVQTLTIDSELGTSIEDCFERISIGEQLPRDAIYRNVSELTTRECEQICKQDKQCQSYDYGVGAKGNATCNLSNANEKELKEKELLRRHPDYDVYVRRFQCEQSPPSPIEAQFDEPTDTQDDRPIQHRPVFRPVDEKQPFIDDYLISSDLAAYGVKRPVYRPQLNDRPDDYANTKPEYDAAPSYGGHKPQDTSILFRPQKPYKNPPYNPRPDPYDVLQVHDPYRPNDKPDENAPYRRPLLPEKHEYQYNVKPKPKPENTGYGFQRPASDGYSSPDKDQGHPRPGAQGYYAGGYGHSNPYENNYVHVEIHDPPSYYYDRPKPLPSDVYGIYGYGTYSNQNSYSQSQTSHGQHYGAGLPQYSGYSDSLSSNRRNQTSYPTYHSQEKPSYSNQMSYGNQDSYNSQYSNQAGYGNNQYYGTTSLKPLNQYKPNYGTHQMSSLETYGNSPDPYGSNHGSYGSNQSSQSSYGQKPIGNRPYLNNEANRPSQAIRPSYGEEASYGQKPVYDRPSYKPDQRPYDNEKPAYGNSQPAYMTDKPSYSQYDPGYQNHKPSYGQYEQAYEDQRPGYGIKKPSYDNDRPSYGSNHDTYGDSLGTYGGGQYFGNNHNSYGSHASHQSEQGSYPGHQPTHGSYRPTVNTNRPPIDFYGNPSQEKPAYNPIQHRPNYGTKPKPTYGQDDESNHGYGNNRPGYDENRPDFVESDDPGSSNTGYEKPNKHGVKPVYEDELEKPNDAPSYIARPGGQVVTSRPMAIEINDPQYGRQHGKHAVYDACFRRVLAGKRALRSHVRKVAPCETVEDCRKECALEKRFPCESFNYRMDRSYRGKGLCELMTKPIEAFDIQRDFVEDKDFDFYERDRNSLEPNCPDKLRGAGLLHSGFLSSKNNRIPDREGWRDRDVDWSERHRDRFGDRTGGYNRYDNRLYIPYQINQGLARSNDDDSWGQYGGDYGGTERYYKYKDDYTKSLSHWKLASEIDRSSFKSNSNFDYNSLRKNGDEPYTYGNGSWKRGRWNSSGTNNGLDYGESNFYKPQSHFHGVNEHGHDPIGSIDQGDEGPIKDCSSRRRPGMSLKSGAVRRSLLFHKVIECEAACFTEREFKCVSYSFRYSNSQGTDNCFLSERPYRGQELSADSSSDVYAMPQDQGCVAINYKPYIESECFWHVRSGAVVSDTAVKAALTVAGLGACEAECIRAHNFFCRGFSFRFDSPTIGDELENCILTSSPPTSLDNGRGLRPNSRHELYARGNYGRGCEPAIYDGTHQNEDDCFLQYDKAARLVGGAIRGQARVKDEQSCGQACNKAPFTCLSFSFNNNASPKTENCLLSEIRLFDLKKDVDYVHSEDDWLFAFDLFNGQCWKKVHGHHHDESSHEVPRPLSAPPVEDPYALPSGPSGPSGPLAGPPGITGPSGPSGPDYPPDHHEPSYIPSGPPSGSGYRPDPPRYPPPTDLGYQGPIRNGYKPGPNNKPGYTAPSGPEEYPGPYKPEYPEPSGPGFRPEYPAPNFKLGYSEFSGSGFKPGFSEPSGPGFKPGYSEPSGPGYKPGYPESPIPGFRPVYPDSPSPGYRPGYPGSSFKPEYSAPSGPGFKPGYPEPSPSFKPGYLGPIGSSYNPEYPSDDGLKPGYSNVNSNFRPGYPPPIKPEYPVRPPNYKPAYPPDFDRKPDFRPPGPQRPAYRPMEQGYIPGKPGYLPEKPDNFRPGYPSLNRPFSDLPKPGRPVGRPANPDRENGEGISSFRHYTVSGLPCRAGSTCAQNRVAGHWACEPEGGEIGSWDYCCIPSHRCGYSEGFHKPWCYVGPSEDQWRPCSEKYYPYHQHNVPHPSQSQQNPGYGVPNRPPQPPWNRPGQPASPPAFNDRPQGPPRPSDFERPQGPYLSEADKKYWDDLYKNGPQAYYDKFGNPLPGYSRVPTAERPHIKVSHNYPPPGTGQWQQLPQETGQEPPPILGVPRYWPVAYLHKGPPPNTTYFRYNETQQTTTTTTTERIESTTTPREKPSTTTNQPNMEKHRDEKKRNISVFEETVTEETTTIKLKPTTTELPVVEEEVVENKTEAETLKPIHVEVDDTIKGIDDKLVDFTTSIEVLDLDEIKGEKPSQLKTLEAEERQIEEIGRILASRRGSKLVLDKNVEKDLETKNIAVDKGLTDYNFGNRFNIERRGIIQKVSKDEIERERAADKSLEASETVFVRPPRVLSTTENIRKAIVNGKIFYDATLRDQRELFLTNSTRRSKSLKNSDDSKISNLAIANNFGKKIVITRNVNPVRRVRRVYRKRYNPDEVRRRLLERERSKQENSTNSSRSI